MRTGLVLLALAAAACVAPAPASGPAALARAPWIGTWATSPQRTEPANLPPAPGLAGNTLRQVVRVSIGGERLRCAFPTRSATGR